jgi:hypothetical protein
MLSSPEHVKALYSAIEEELTRRSKAAVAVTSTSQNAPLRRQLRQAEQKLDGHLDFIGQVGGRAPKSMLQRITTLENRIAALRDELAPPTKGAKIRTPTKAQIRNHLSQLAGALSRGDPLTRRDVYRSLIKRILVYPKKITIEGSPGRCLPEELTRSGIDLETVGQRYHLPIWAGLTSTPPNIITFQAQQNSTNHTLTPAGLESCPNRIQREETVEAILHCPRRAQMAVMGEGPP